MKKKLFEKNELDLNKRGFLSPRQMARVRSKMMKFFGLIIFLWIWTVFVFVFVFSARIVLFGSIGAVILLAFLSWAFFIWYRMKKATGVKIIEGEADFDINYTGRDPDNQTPVYIVKIDNKKFVVEESVYDELKGKRFRFYYFSAPQKMLLSYETLEE